MKRSLASEAARRLASMRKTFGSGRPPDQSVPRCECRKMTLKRAQARGKSAEHDPSCDFFKAAK